MSTSESSASEAQKRAYEALDAYFTQHEDETVAVEVLPPQTQCPDGELFLSEGLNLGIPKRTLVLAYVWARQLFLAAKKDTTSLSSDRASGPSRRGQTALRASKIILLFDPEHITAAHFRKRRIVSLQGTKDFDRSVDQEHKFLDTVLKSPLHRQCKSPTLWYHRLWLIDVILSVNRANVTGEGFLSLIKAELEAVFKAGEHHPKNYYAWQFARRIFVKIEHLVEDEDLQSWKASYSTFLIDCTFLVKSWCLQHTSDISGWSFLLFLLTKTQPISIRHTIVQEVLDWTVKIQSEQESLWVFLKLALADISILQSERGSLIQQLRNYVEHGVCGRTNGRSSSNAANWIETYDGLQFERSVNFR